MKEITKLKKAATKAETARVFEGYNLPPRDITIYDAIGNPISVRRAWQSGNRFGWKGWEDVN